MRYLILSLSGLLAFTNCQQESVKSEPRNIQSNDITKKYIDTLLDFDEVIHYQHPTLDWDNTIDARDISKASEKEILLYRIGFSGSGRTLKNIDEVEDLEYVGYVKNVLDKSQVELVKFIAYNRDLCKEIHPRQQFEKVEEAKQQSNIIGQKLFPIYYLKILLSAINHKRINYQNSYKPTICEPIYRDILYFKKNGQTVGFVKICFDCSVTSGVTLNNHSLYLKRCYIILKGVLDGHITSLENLD